MRIMILGAAGFIGGHLTQELIRRGHEILGMDDLSIHQGVEPKWIKLTKKSGATWLLGSDGNCMVDWYMQKAIQDFNPSTIFNLAVLPLPHSLEHPIDNFIINTGITGNILKEMGIQNKERQYNDENPIRLVHFSSSEVYGTAQEDVITEEHVLRPTTPYAAAKAACDHLVMSYVNTFGVDAKIVRPFNTIGPRQNDKSYAAIIPLTVKRIKEGIPPIIYGDGSKTRDFTSVTDVVQGAIAVMEKGRSGEAYNICSSKETSVLELMDLISEELEYKGGYQFSDEREGDVTRHLGCNRKALIELGWAPKVSLRDSVREAVRGWPYK